MNAEEKKNIESKYFHLRDISDSFSREIAGMNKVVKAPLIIFGVLGLGDWLIMYKGSVYGFGHFVGFVFLGLLLAISLYFEGTRNAVHEFDSEKEDIDKYSGYVVSDEEWNEVKQLWKKEFGELACVEYRLHDLRSFYGKEIGVHIPMKSMEFYRRYHKMLIEGEKQGRGEKIGKIAVWVIFLGIPVGWIIANELGLF